MANYLRGEITVFPRPVSVTSVDVEYAIGSSTTTPPTSGWQTTMPPPTSSEPYIWSRTKTIQSNIEQPLYSVPMCISSESGSTVIDIQEEYYLSTSSQEPTGSQEGWVQNPPEWESGYYIWARSVIFYSDDTSATSDPVLATALNDNGETQAALEQAVSSLNETIVQVRNISQDNARRLNNLTARVYISGNRISFVDESGNEVAYLNGNEFHFNQGYIDTSLRVGNYVIRDDGHGGFAIV